MPSPKWASTWQSSRRGQVGLEARRRMSLSSVSDVSPCLSTFAVLTRSTTRQHISRRSSDLFDRHPQPVPPVAEGIETQRQLEVVHAAGCQLAQGYLFAGPVPLSQLLSMVGEKGRPIPHEAVSSTRCRKPIRDFPLSPN